MAARDAMAASGHRPLRCPGQGGGLAGLAASALLFALLAPVPARHDERLGQEIVASHVRALLSQHPVDVVSTDQHTVKPWFNGRLDYAPPVVDLATRGFPLAGGRMDYVAHRRVAVLVYRDQRHPIDLYVLPAAEGACTPANRSADGYAMVRWCAAGMDFWAISDAEPAHVRAFAQALRDAVGDRGNKSAAGPVLRMHGPPAAARCDTRGNRRGRHAPARCPPKAEAAHRGSHHHSPRSAS